jgi:hypothetical protein
MMKLALTNVRVDQLTRFYREGSVLGGTIKSGSLGVEVAIDVESDEPPERIAELVRVARASCFTHGTVAEPVTVETRLRLNGQPLESGAAR